MKAAIVLAVLVLAVSQARAQSNICPPGSTIYIDPRLAPRRPIVTREQFVAPRNWMTEEESRRLDEMAYEQNQPIQVPFRDGVVFIHPHNPCIQQYLGK